MAETARTRRANGPGLFVYGTLMDADVRSLVIGRPLEAAELQPVALNNYRRVYIAGRLYPMVLPRRGSTVEGLLLSGLSEDDFARLDAFEGADYHRERQHVSSLGEGASDEPVLAWFYRTRGVITPSFKVWNLEDWRVREKTIFLRAAKVWLTELGLRPAR